MDLCQICGNEIKHGKAVCPFCGSKHVSPTRRSTDRNFLHHTVNLEQGMPFVQSALNHLQVAIREAKSGRVQVLTIIHGYGSSGKGGAIRKECRKTLDYMCSRGQLNSYVPGEDFHKHNGVVKDLLNRYPQLRLNKNLNRRNQGITVVVL